MCAQSVCKRCSGVLLFRGVNTSSRCLSGHRTLKLVGTCLIHFDSRWLLDSVSTVDDVSESRVDEKASAAAARRSTEVITALVHVAW